MTAFTLNQADLAFILRQIKVAEAHAAGIPLTSVYVNAEGNVVPAGTPGAVLAIPDPHVPVGLRTVDGSYNNLVPGRELWGASGQPMPRLFAPNYINDADGDQMPFGAPGAPVVTNNDYGVINGVPTNPNAPGGNGGNTGNVADADPRTISNLIVDMSMNNPAAVLAALTFAGSEDPMADLEEILTLNISAAEAAAAVAAATAVLDDANAALDVAVAAYLPGNTDAIDDIQEAAEAVTTAEANLAQAQAVAADPHAAMVALAEAKGLSFNNGSLDIPNIAPDEGLSAPFNAWMTFFGQFFDHGLDLISKGGNGTIYIPLAADDPLRTHGVDGIAGNGDEVDPNNAFMVLTRSTTVTGPDGEPTQRNVTTPFVDQNQTYTSHASHQVFLREYALDANGRPVATGRLLGGENGGLATWADVKEQAQEMLGIQLTDMDVFAVPLLRTDAYGEFIRNPATGFAQVITGLGVDGIPNTADDIVVSGTPQAPVNLFAVGAIRTNNAFLDDIAHDAVPGTVYDADGDPATPATAVVQADADGEVNAGPIDTDYRGRKTSYDDELLDRHFVTGDGRGNENIGLSAVHHVFHSEHNRQVDAQKLTILQTGNLSFVNEWLAVDTDAATLAAFNAGFDTAGNKADYLAGSALFTGGGWDGERLFQAARFATEMQYQHLVFEEFGRKIQPNIDVFVFNNITDVDPRIFGEFANVIYRFGHSMLTENMPRIDASGNVMDGGDLTLIESFLNPVLFDNDGGISHDEGAAAIIRGMTIERGNEIDEFITGALRNNLLGLPLDLAAINIARGRDTGMPTLNEARQQLFDASGSTFLTPYESWVDFAANLKNPMSVVNFIAAYGMHTTITSATTLEAKRAAAMELVLGVDAGGNASEILDRVEFLNSTGDWNAGNSGLNDIDLWIGGLAEKKMPFGGFLGSTFNAVFELQMENLQDGDRFYYLTRTQGQNLLNSLEQNSFAKLLMANTNLAQPGPDGIRGTADDIVERHIGVDSFAAYDYVLEVNPANQADYDPEDDSLSGVDPVGNDPVLEALGLGKVVRTDPSGAVTANYIRVFGGEHVVVGGTNGNDTIITDFGDDGIWGDAGDDRIESGAGVDLVNGGAGNDIITDSGDTGDFLKGDEGDDVIANSNGLDILMGGSGKDVFFVGVDATEVFAGEGDDFILGGDDMDFLLGNEGDDWMEAGAGFDTTAGDNSELFFNSAIKGHDVMFAGSDEHDFDAESGDDIMVQGESVMRNEGMFGFDWAIFKGMDLNGYADMNIPIFTTEQADILRNRFDKVEALSGWENDDTLIGDSRVFGAADGTTVGTAEGVFFNDGLDQAGIDRIEGLGQIVQVGATGFFESGNILLGGAGSDILEGNAGDDILDGDRWLNVRIRITGAGQDNTAENQIASVDSLRHVFTAAENPAWAGRSLFELLIARTVVPNQLHIVREIIEDDGVGDTDIAVFNDVRANYSITGNADGSIRVEHVTVTAGAIDPASGANLVSDGVDTLRNFEVLRFTDGDFALTPPELRLNGFDAGTFADNFNTAALTNSTGSTPWTTAWVETNDSGGVTTGQIRIDAGNSNTLQFIGNLPANGSDGAQITRGINLAGATQATLAYSANPDNLDPGESVTVQFSADGITFVDLNTITGNGGNQDFNHTLTGPFTANAAVRFVATAITGNANEVVTINDLAVTFTKQADPATTDVEATFTEDGAAVPIASLPSIVDDSATMASARIVLTNAEAGDQLVIGGLPAGIAGAIDTTVGGQITVTLTGTASRSTYQDAIQAVSFRNTSQAPNVDDRIIHVTVNDGLVDSNIATSTIHVVSVNDAPNAANDRIVTNVVNGVAFQLPDWALMANDTDGDGPFVITGVGGANNLTATWPAGGPVTITDTGTTNGGSFTYTVSDGAATDVATVQVIRDTTNPIGGGGLFGGNGGNDIMVGDGVANVLEGAGGNDLIFAGGGDDTINWTATSIGALNIANDGRDFADGGAGTLDRFVVNGSGSAETFVVYAAADAIAAGFAGLKPGTEIVITRNGAVIAELDNIEEITINTGAGNDSVTAVGNFNPTSLAFNTITINGDGGNDTVDVSSLQSAHRILFRSNGGNDTIVGNLRPQDVVELAPGSNLDSYTLADNGNGTQTLSNGTHSITFTGAVLPQFQNTPAPGGNDEGVSGVFEYTPGDIAGLKALVNGQQPANGDDDGGPTGVRDLSGHGNNVANPNWGAADQPFIRITNPHYGEADANGNLAINPIFDGLDPRSISNILGSQEAGLPHAGNDANIFFMAMGQYIDHGLDFLGKGGYGAIQIGALGGGAPGSGNPSDLTRATVAGYDENGVPQHTNYTSPYVDQNQAYGSNELVGQFLRASDGNGGLGAHLFAGAPDPSNPEFSLLPTLRELIQHHWENNTIFHSQSLQGGAIAFQDYFAGLVDINGVINAAMLPAMVSNFMGTSHALLLDANPFINVLDHYIAGDGRANENFALTSIHTIWARNHNHHVEGLAAAGFEGSAEELFQAAKMINEAEYQRVVFDEYLETLLGGLQSQGTHGFEEYDPTAIAGISHEFAGAVFRFGHSLIGQTMTVLDADGNPTQVNLFDAFLNPSNDPSVFPVDPSAYYTPQPGYAQHGVNAIIGGTVSQPAEDVDFNIVDAVRNDLVRINADLFAFNVARGWDLGLGTLNQVRSDLAASTNPYVSESVGFAGGDLSPYASWADFQQRNNLSNAVIAQFQQAYPDLVLTAADIAAFQQINPDIAVAMQDDGTGIVSGIDRVDLWVGGLAEQHINGGVVGQTFWVVLSEQFERLQDGDRFYYISRFDNFDFYENFIDGQEFADIVARNTGMTGLPEHMFRTDPIDDAETPNDDGDDDQDEDQDDDDGTPVGDGDDENDGDEDDDNDEEDDEDGDTPPTGDDDEDTPTTPTPPVTGVIRTGTPQPDVLVGSAGDDNIVAFAEADVIVADAGADAISAGDGDDFVNAGAGRDVIFAGAGNDQVFAGDGADIVYGDAGNDRIFGDQGNDLISAGAGDDTVFGGAGNDLLVAEIGDGNDVYFGDDSEGGTGIDTIDLSAATVAVTVNLGAGPLLNGSVFSSQTGNDTIWGIENVNTGSGNDVITASNAVNVINGGAGNDTFRFLTASAADGDTILGFEPGDRLDLSGMDANIGSNGDQSFALVTGAAFTAAGQLAVSFESRQDGDFTIVQGNIDGNADADFEIQIAGHQNLNAGNISL